MTPRAMARCTHLLCGGAGVICGLIIAVLAGGWSESGFLLWPLFVFLGITLFLQQHLSRKGRELMENRESSALERLVDMKREVDKTAHRYKCLLEGAGNAIFVFDADSGKLREVNRKGTELLDYSKNEMLTLAGKDLTPHFERRRFSDLVRRVKRRGRGRVDSITFKRRDGEEFLGEVEARLIDLDDEKVVHVTVRDITFKSRAEKEIRQRNRELSILNAIVSRANENLQLDSVLQAVLAESVDVFGANAGMIHLLSRDGSGMALSAQMNIPDDIIVRIDRHRCASHERFCSHTLPFHEGARKCLIAASMEQMNARTLAGIPLHAKQKVIGVMHLLFNAERSHPAEEERFFSTLGNQIGMVLEHARIFAELTWKTDELSRSYGLLEKNSHQLALSQKRLKMNLALVERANKDLERLDRMKSHFLGIISHEFRTPLTTILGGSQFLMATISKRPEEEQRLLTIIHEGGARLNDIVTNLLKVARLEAKSTALKKAPLDLSRILNDLHTNFLPVLNDREQTLIFHNLETIPPVSADREYVEEIFRQLIENAIKFSRNGDKINILASLSDKTGLEPKREIITSFNHRFFDLIGTSNFIQIEIRDSGIGINGDDHLHIFDKFYGAGDIRHHSSGKGKFQGKGPGIGLSIVKGMVEAHGGMVWVESPGQNLEDNPGSSFFVLMPTEEAELQPAFAFMQSGNDSDSPEDVPLNQSWPSTPLDLQR